MRQVYFNLNQDQLDNILGIHDDFIMRKLVSMLEQGDHLDYDELEIGLKEARINMWEDFHKHDSEFIAKLEQDGFFDDE
mgnify:CR=1 FL=1